MSTPKGYSSQEKEDRLSAQFSTVEPVREHQFGLSVNAHQYVYSAASDTAEAGSTAKVIVATGHAAKKGDILFFYSGSLGNIEVKVWDVGVNSIELAEELPAAPIVGDTFDVLRHKYPVVNSDGTPILTLTEQAIGNNGVAPSTDEVKMMGGFDGTDARYVKTDTDGELQVDVLSSALPAGAATEATLSTLATEATVSTLATEATVSTLATEATVSTLATAATQTDGSQKTQIVDGSGNVISSTGNALDVNLKTPVVVDVSLSQANDSVAVFGSDGAVNRALKTDANGELQVDVLSSALPTGAATEASLLNVATSANQTNGSQKSQIVDGAGDIADVVLLSTNLQATDKGLVTNTIIHGETTGGGGGYVDVKVTPSGALTTETTLAGLDAAVLGQDTMANSLPVVIASDQTAIPVSGTVTVSSITNALPAGNNNIGDVDIASALPAGTNTIGKVDVNTLSPVDFARLDYTAVPGGVLTSAYTQLKASLAAAVKEVEIFDSSGQTLFFAVGAAASEVDKFYIIPGGNGRFPITIAAASRVAIKAVSATANTGEISVNFLG